ncbi:OmpA family protein [Streptomyces sp. NPDC005438]|uniref:OmpA family protein n=1 Tax=Streptomyces sp. NPDC005438 TaxID=3156880 RepID=UPI0033A5BF90
MAARNHRHRRAAATTLAATVLFTGVQLGGATSALADDPPGTESTAKPPEVDENDPDLKLPGSAKLAPAKVLDIVQVVESQGGEERREDTNENVKIGLQAEVLFGKDSSKLNSAADDRIAEVVAEIKKQSATRVNVFGFTDNLGSYEHGKKLSKDRAEAVHKALEKQLDDSSDVTFKIRGYSEDYPIASNSTEEGRKKNRRVEISFPRQD